MSANRLTGLVVVAVIWCSSAHAVTIETVPVGNAGNAPDTRIMSSGSRFGSVGYNYHIGKFEVTNAQYVEFLNAVDPTGARELGLYRQIMSINGNGGINFSFSAANGSKFEVKPGQDNKPVVHVSWYSALRFANWLHNGQGSGDTENGSYRLRGPAPVPTSVARSPGATWRLPTEDEWHKAAYHYNDGVTGNYWDYPTSTNVEPYSDQPPGADAPDQSNTANYYNRDFNNTNGFNDGLAVTGTSFATIDHYENYLTDVGAYTLSTSPYGTFDQGGNALEWTESRLSSGIVVRGGSWRTFASELHASHRFSTGPMDQLVNSLGFRLVYIPEPSSLLMAMLAGVGILRLRRRSF